MCHLVLNDSGFWSRPEINRGFEVQAQTLVIKQQSVTFLPTGVHLDSMEAHTGHFDWRDFVWTNRCDCADEADETFHFHTRFWWLETQQTPTVWSPPSPPHLSPKRTSPAWPDWTTTEPPPRYTHPSKPLNTGDVFVWVRGLFDSVPLWNTRGKTKTGAAGRKWTTNQKSWLV